MCRRAGRETRSPASPTRRDPSSAGAADTTRLQRSSRNSTTKNNKTAIIYCQTKIAENSYSRLQRAHNENPGLSPWPALDTRSDQMGRPRYAFFHRAPFSGCRASLRSPSEVDRIVVCRHHDDGIRRSGHRFLWFSVCVPYPFRRSGGGRNFRALHPSRPPASNPGISRIVPYRRPEATLLDRARPDSRRRQHTFLCRISGGRDIPDLQ